MTDKVNAALEETVREGLFAFECKVDLDVVHHFAAAASLLEEVKTWTGTTVPPASQAIGASIRRA